MNKIPHIMAMATLLVIMWLVPTHAAWYVAPAASGGNDSNPGTRASPFLTFERAKTAMAGSGDKTTYLRNGTHVRTSPYTFNSNETGEGDPLDAPHAAIINATRITTNGRAFICNACTNVAMRNFSFTSPPSLNGGAYPATTFSIENQSDGVYIENNIFAGNASAFDETTIYSGESLGIYIRGNTFQGPNSGQPITWSSGFTRTYTNIYITDNNIAGCQRWCVEVISHAASTPMDHFHIDRNVFTDLAGDPGLCEGVGNPAGAISGDQQHLNNLPSDE